MGLSEENFTYQLAEVGNDGKEETGEHRPHSLGALLYQSNGDLNSLQEDFDKTLQWK